MGLDLSSRWRRVALASLLVSATVFLSGCSAEEKGSLKRLAEPLPITKQATELHHLWIWAWVAAMSVGVIVWGLMFYVVVRYRRRSETHVPVQTRYNLPIEVFYTIAPIMMVIVFFFFTVKTQDSIVETASNPSRTVTVVGQQWSWTFNYNTKWSEKDKKFVADSQGGDQVYEGGTTADRPTLWLVKGETVQFDLYSPDVVHSFWVPAFLYKMDVVPGRHNHFGVTPSRYGTFDGRCAEFCGVYHSRMLFNVKVVNQSQYDAHLKSLAKQGSTGTALGSSYTTVVPGLENQGGKQ